MTAIYRCGMCEFMFPHAGPLCPSCDSDEIEPMADALQHSGRARADALALIYRHTHRDYRGRLNGERSILVFEPGHGTCLVPLSSLTEAQIADKLPYALRCEEKRRAEP